MRQRVWTALMLLGSAVAAAAQPAPSPGEFVPASSLPPVETFPAAPMVIVAYGVVWAAVLAFVWYIWRRLQQVERDIDDLERRARGR
jgi:CcmD family protein